MGGREDGVGVSLGFLLGGWGSLFCGLLCWSCPVDERLVGVRWNGEGDCVIAGWYLARSVDGSAEGCR